MKQSLLFVLIFPFLLTAQNLATLEIGSKAPMMDLKMRATDGNEYSLSDTKNINGTLVIFSCNTCPFVVMWEDRYTMLEEICTKNKVGMVYLNSNEKKRDQDDSFDAMVQHSIENSYSFPYLVDEKSTLANAFNAKTTPHVFLFDQNNVLVYKGAIDDNYESKKEVKSFYVKEAVVQLASKNTILTKETKPVGCSIKIVRN